MSSTLLFQSAITFHLLQVIINVSADTFDASVAGEFENTTITCNPNEPCTIICDQNDACKSSIIECPSNQQCTIECPKPKSCSHATITCPSNNQCDITCRGWESCAYINIDPPQELSLFNVDFPHRDALKGVTYPFYPPYDNYTEFNLVCDVYRQCYLMNIICPAHAECNIFCNGTNACDSMQVTWPLEDGLGNLICDGDHACYSGLGADGINFPMPLDTEPYTVTCNNTDECWGANIYCPTNARCTINCGARNACGQTSIYCSYNAICDVNCLVDDACYNTRIYSSNSSSGQANVYCWEGDASLNEAACTQIQQLEWNAPPTIATTLWPTVETDPPSQKPSVSQGSTPSSMVPTEDESYAFKHEVFCNIVIIVFVLIYKSI